MATPTLTQPPPSDAARPRHSRRWAVWLLGLTLSSVIVTLIIHSILIRQMRLPRLTLSPGVHVTGVAITPDGKRVFSGSDPTSYSRRLRANASADVFEWDAGAGKLVRRLPGLYWRSEGVAVSHDSRLVLAYGNTQPRDDPDAKKLPQSGTLAWDEQSGQKLWTTQSALPLSFSPAGRLIGSAGGLLDVRSGQLIKKVSDTVAYDGQTSFTHDGRLFGFIAAPTLGKNGLIDNDNGGRLYYSTTRLHLLDIDSKREVYEFPFIRVRAFDIARDGQWLVMTSENGRMIGGTDGSIVRRVSVKTGTVLWTRERNMNEQGHDADSILNSVAITPNGKHVVVLSTGDRIIVLDAKTGREEFRTLLGREGGGWNYSGGLAFSADGKTLTSRYGDKVLVWDASSLQ